METETLKELVDLSGLPQAEVARAIGVSQPTLHTWMRGYCAIPSDKALLLHRCLVDVVRRRFERAGAILQREALG